MINNKFVILILIFSLIFILSIYRHYSMIKYYESQIEEFNGEKELIDKRMKACQDDSYKCQEVYEYERKRFFL